MIYLSSTTNIPEQYHDAFGVMFSAKYSIGGLNNALDSGWSWMMDNNNFTGDFDTELWLGALLKFLPYHDTCLGIPIPDKVGDALETLRLFSQYWRVVHDLGYPVAFVSQDGITPEITPWDYFDVLFIGGTDDHKLGQEAPVMIAEALKRDKWVHIGRVNSASRIKRFYMADSVDGTFFNIRRRYLPDESEEMRQRRLSDDFDKISAAIEYCRNKKSGRLGTNGQFNIHFPLSGSHSSGQLDGGMVRTSDDDN